MAATDNNQHEGSGQNIAAAVAEVSERATILIREEIELAKAEVSERVGKILRGSVVAAAAGIFVLTALLFALIGFALLLYYELPGNPYTYFWGFFAMAVILLLLGALAGFLAAKAFKAGSPPVPTMAIQEARKIRETVGSSTDSNSERKGEGDAAALGRRDS